MQTRSEAPVKQPAGLYHHGEGRCAGTVVEKVSHRKTIDAERSQQVVDCDADRAARLMDDVLRCMLKGYYINNPHNGGVHFAKQCGIKNANLCVTMYTRVCVAWEPFSECAFTFPVLLAFSILASHRANSYQHCILVVVRLSPDKRMELLSLPPLIGDCINLKANSRSDEFCFQGFSGRIFPAKSFFDDLP